MNIFYLNSCPVLAAQAQCDSHVNKMISESAQLMVTAHVATTGTRPLGSCAPTHPNHPCAVWTRESTANYVWLYRHFCALLDEFAWRRRGRKTHEYERMREMLSSPPPIKCQTPTRVRQAMPDMYKRKKAVQAYKAYYKHDKQHNIRFKYTRRERPDWL